MLTSHMENDSNTGQGVSRMLDRENGCDGKPTNRDITAKPTPKREHMVDDGGRGTYRPYGLSTTSNMSEIGACGRCR